MPRKANTSKTKSERKSKAAGKNKVADTAYSKFTFLKHRNFLIVVLSLLILFALSLLYFVSFPEKKEDVLSEESVTVPPVPVLKENVPGLSFSARGIYAVDQYSGKVLFAKNENDPLLPASTTKIATALVALKTFSPDQVITITSTPRVAGQIMGLRSGEQITVMNLIYGLLVFSANDAAEVLAVNHPLGRAGFIEEMNKLAQQNGLSKTHFTNPVGFDDYLHFATASDLVKLAEIAQENSTFAQIVNTTNYQVTSVDGKIIHNLTNTNQLLGKVPGVIGVKTGHTDTSRESLVTNVERDGKKIFIALLGSEDRFGETRMLIDWIFTNYEWK